MKFLRINILKNFLIFKYLLILLFFIYSFYIIIYQYDGHHVGLMYSNAIDLIKGKLPYKEIFIQYGFLTTLIHSLILLIFDNKVFFICVFNIIFYSLGILFISKTVDNLINVNYSLLATIIILFNHPIPWLPWSNYLAFFFISVSLFLLSGKNKYFLPVGIFLSLSVLSRQDFFIPIFLSFIIFCIFYILEKKKICYKCLTQLIIGFFLPIIIFLSYLFIFDIYKNWIDYLSIPKFYLDLYGVSLINIIFDYIVFFLTESFFNFIDTPQYFLISILLIFNSILIFLKIINRIKIPNNIFFMILLSTFLSSTSVKIELFRLYTSVIFALIPLLYFLDKIKINELRNKVILLVLLPAMYSLIFYPFGNNDQFNKIDFHNQNLELTSNKFDYFKWPNTKVFAINKISNLAKRCNVEFLDNLTFDSIFSTIGDYDRIRLLPYEKVSLKNSEFHKYIDSIKNPNSDFIKLINYEIQKNNIILLINKNNNINENNKIKFTSAYDLIEINESNIIGKPNILRIYYPLKCLN